jgi:hypothetical protein
VKRIRAKLSEEALERIEKGELKGDEHFYLPTDDKVARQRQINAALWEKSLGYFRRGVPTQTTQLPRPVGEISFFQVSEYEFTAQGADRKQYRVTSTPQDYWICECEAFRYASRVKTRTCKHIKAIQDHQKAVEAEQAAKNQSNLF